MKPEGSTVGAGGERKDPASALPGEETPLAATSENGGGAGGLFGRAANLHKLNINSERFFGRRLLLLPRAVARKLGVVNNFIFASSEVPTFREPAAIGWRQNFGERRSRIDGALSFAKKPCALLFLRGGDCLRSPTREVRGLGHCHFLQSTQRPPSPLAFQQSVSAWKVVECAVWEIARPSSRRPEILPCSRPADTEHTTPRGSHSLESR